MVALENILLVNTGISSVLLIVLLFLSGKKNHRFKEKKILSKDLKEIKNQVSE